ncbi:MAG: hypothetical protein J6S56_02005 [Bacteroidales bacterium]|nr:hypothetical protein [Bacteroidales bacterium]
MTEKRSPYFITYALAILFGCTAGFIVIINLLKSKFTNVLVNFHKLETLLPNPVLMLLGLGFIILLYLLLRNTGNRPQRLLSERGTLLLAGGIFFCIQMYLIYNYCFKSGWDVQIVLDTARRIADGEKDFPYTWYFSSYPNNLFLTHIFAFILWVTKPLHLGHFDFLAIVTVQSMLCVLTAWMLYQIIVGQFQRRGLAWFGMALYLLLVGLSPWTSIPYSDAWGLFFATAVLWTSTCSALKDKPFLRWFLTATIAYLGFKIKPQIIFVFASVVVVDVLRFLCQKKRQPMDRKFWLGSPLGVSAGLAAAFFFVLIITSTSPVKYRHNGRYGAAHYLMMGMNHLSIGGYCDDDVVFSHQFKTPRERNKANRQEAARRIHEMGPRMFGFLVCEKTLINYYDGTFNWGKEGEFYKTIFLERNRHLSPFLRNVYYNHHIHGAYYPYWCTGSTAIWLSVLALMVFAAFGKPNRFSAILMIIILFLTLFEAFFEARARYLYSFIPFYILLAIKGLQQIEQGISHISQKLRKSA